MIYPNENLFPSTSLFPQASTKSKILTGDFTEVKNIINILVKKRTYGDRPLNEYEVTIDTPEAGKILGVEDANKLLDPYLRMISDDASIEPSSEKLKSGDIIKKNKFNNEKVLAQTYSDFDQYHNNQSQSGCGNNCSGLCVTICANLCKGACVGICGNACAGTCSSTCKSTCSASCSFNCSGTCAKGCSSSETSYGCGTTCSTSCGYNCTGTCSKKCTKTSMYSYTGCRACTASCGGGQPCEARCSTNCTNLCSGTCSNTCTGTCGKSCILSCSGSVVQKDWIEDMSHVWDEFQFKTQVTLPPTDTTWKIPTGVKKIFYFIVGGGGGSAGQTKKEYDDSWYYVLGSGGGGGGYTTSGVIDTLGDGTDYFTYTIGEGGSAGAAYTSGGDGDPSTLKYYQSSTLINSYQASGGKGSAVSSTGMTSLSAYGGAGGSGGGDGVPPKYIKCHCVLNRENFWRGYPTNGGRDGNDGVGFQAYNDDSQSATKWQTSDNHEFSPNGKGQGTSTTCPYNGITYGCGGGGGGLEHYGDGNAYALYDGGKGFSGAGNGERWRTTDSPEAPGRLSVVSGKSINPFTYIASSSSDYNYNGTDGTGGGAGGCHTMWSPKWAISYIHSGYKGGRGTILIFY